MNTTLRAAGLLAATALSLAMADAANAATVSMNSSATSLVVGQAFTVDVFANDVSEADQLLAFGFDVVTDAGLSFLGADVIAPFLDDSGFFQDTDVAGSIFPAMSGTGIHLATLHFQAGSAAGLFYLGMATDPASLGFSEGLITEFSVFDIAESLAVNVSAVPLPAALPLLVTGLMGIFGMGLRRRA